MKKPLIITALLILPALLILLGFYLDKEILISLGCIVLIFFIIMALRGKFTEQKENK